MLPNIITSVRIVASPGLILLALADQPIWLIVLAVFLVFTEWLDGYLARRMHTTSELGARLDTVADAVFYSSMLVATVLFRPNLMLRESAWMSAAVGSYAINWIASWIKFRRLPSYHTWAAKGVWGIVGLGIISLLSGFNPWPFRIAMICVLLTNLEAICITLTLTESKVDVPFWWHIRNAQSPSKDTPFSPEKNET